MTVTVAWPAPTLHTVVWRPFPVTESASILASQFPAYRPPAAGRPAEYRVMVLDRHLNPLDELTDAVVTNVHKVRNGVGDATVRVRLNTTGAQHLVQRQAADGPRFWMFGRLVQIWRQNHPIFTGMPDDPTYDAATGWYESTLREHGPGDMADVTLGKAQRITYTRNGSFEMGGTWWYPHNCEVSFDTSRKRLGSQSVKLTGTGSDDAYLEQIDKPPNTTLSGGNNVRVSAWYYLESGTSVPLYGNGLAVYVRENSVPRAKNSAVGVPIDTKGDWVRQTVAIHQTPNEQTDVVDRLRCPKTGSIWWDDVQVVRDDSTGVKAGGDTADLAAELVRAVAVTNGWNWGRTVVATGHKYPSGFAYHHAEHPNAKDALDDCVAFGDYEWVHNSRSSLGFRFYPPRKTPRRDIVLTPDTTSGLTIGNTIDGAASFVGILGDADDYAREEGSAFDSAGFAGIRVDLWEDAPPNTKTGDLEQYAKDRLKKVRRPPAVVDASPSDSGTSPVRVSGELVHRIHQGDVLICEVPVDVNEVGTVKLRSLQRVEAWTLDPLTDTLSLDLAEATDA